MTTDRVASVNVFKGLPQKVAARILDDVLPHADLAGLQEWPGGRNRLLERLSRLPGTRRRLARRARWQPTPGHAWARPLAGGGPVGARADRYELRALHARLLAGRGRVDKAPGRRTWLAASIAVDAVYRDHWLGEDVALLNYHLTAGVQKNGRYRHDQPKRVARHKREHRRLERIVARHLEAGRRVYTTGDSNFDGFHITGLISCWQGREHVGTLGRRAVDAIHTQQRADQVRVLHSRSDHHHPVAVYRRTTPQETP